MEWLWMIAYYALCILFFVVLIRLVMKKRIWRTVLMVIPAFLLWGVMQPVIFQRQLIQATIPPIFEVVEETQFNTWWDVCTYAEYRVRRIADFDELSDRYVDKTEDYHRAMAGEYIRLDDVGRGKKFYVIGGNYFDVFKNTKTVNILTEIYSYMLEGCGMGEISSEEFDRRSDIPSYPADAIFGDSWIYGEKWVYSEELGVLIHFGLFQHGVLMRKLFFLVVG